MDYLTVEVNLLYATVVVAVLILIYRYVTRGDKYFHDKPIPSMAVTPVLGSTGPLFLKKYSFSDFIAMIYNKYQGVKVFGLSDTGTHLFVIRDPAMIKQITVKDFDYFVDRRQFFGEPDEHDETVLFTKTLLTMRDQKWRDMRATLSPAFTGSKMRAMFALIVEYGDQLGEILRQEAAASGHVDYEMKDLYTRIANDIIATCAFGLQVESVRDRENEFYVSGKRMLNFNRLSVLVRVFALRFIPQIMKRLGVDIIDREQSDYFRRIIQGAVHTRETEGIVRPDMIHLLMQARKGTLKHHHEAEQSAEGFATVEESTVGTRTVSKTMSESEFIAQCLIFFLAGFDTVSNGFMFTSYELALNPDVQQKLYEEIVQTKEELAGKPLTYETLQKMKYMDMVVCESLRKWPVPAIDRMCVRDYVFDDGEGLRFTIEKGKCVWFPIHGIHRDPKYYPNPEKFDPERFSETNRSSINPDAYLPFGAGPRNCIGSRFALMEMKAILFQVLLHFSLERYDNTQVPLQLVKGFTGMACENGMHLRLKLRK